MSTVAELIEFLKKQQQDLPVAYCIYSEYTLLEFDDIRIVDACESRKDGWVQDKRPDVKSIPYLMFPGN